MAELKEKLALLTTIYKLQGGTPEKTFSHVCIPRKLTAETLVANRARNL